MSDLDYEGSSSEDDEGKYSQDSREGGSRDSSYSEGEKGRDRDNKDAGEASSEAVGPQLTLCSRHKPGQMVGLPSA